MLDVPLTSPCIILGPTPITQIKSLAQLGVAPTCLAWNTREADQDQETPQQPLHGQSLPPMLLKSGFTLLEMSVAESSATRSPRFFASRSAPSCLDLYPRQWGVCATRKWFSNTTFLSKRQGSGKKGSKIILEQRNQCWLFITSSCDYGITNSLCQEKWRSSLRVPLGYLSWENNLKILIEHGHLRTYHSISLAPTSAQVLVFHGG